MPIWQYDNMTTWQYVNMTILLLNWGLHVQLSFTEFPHFLALWELNPRHIRVHHVIALRLDVSVCITILSIYILRKPSLLQWIRCYLACLSLYRS
jgi:hypothetical protein